MHGGKHMVCISERAKAGWGLRAFGALRVLSVCLLLCCFVLIPARAQEELNGDSPENAEGSDSAQPGEWTDEMVGPHPPEGLIIESHGAVASGMPVRPPFLEIFTDSTQEIPVLKVNGQYFDPSGLCSLGPLHEESDGAIRSRMLKAADMGFGCFVLRVDWLALEPEPNRLQDSRVKELLSAADGFGLKVIISLELDRAPAWFFRADPGRLMESRLWDPEQGHARGNDGPLRWANGTGVPIMYHEGTLRAYENLIYSLYYTLKDEPALLGWLISGPVTFSYPGSGKDGVVGICDYSPYSVNRYYQATGTQEMVYPLPRYSQGKGDERADFRVFMELRLLWKRFAFEAVLNAMRKVDEEHLVLVGMEPVLSYRDDNGLSSMVHVPDGTWQLVQSGVDGALIGFRLASNSFEAVNLDTESSATHLVLTINQVLRNGKVALVAVEADGSNPPSLNDISQLASMLKTAGAYPIWSSGFLQRRSHRWTWTEENAIERTQPLSLLPAPRRLRRGEVGILDVPLYYSTYYAERDSTLVLSLTQLAIHQRTGVLLEVVGVDELNTIRPVLEQYSSLIYLAPELFTTEQARGTWLGPATQIALAGYIRISGGTVEAAEELLLHQYMLEGFHSVVLEDQLRIKYVGRGAPADILNGADAFILANDPYVFIRVNSMRGTRYIDVKLTGWPEADLTGMKVVELPSGDRSALEVVSSNASFRLGPTRNTGYLYIRKNDYAPRDRMYENRLVGVAIAQQSRNMRRSVPAALLLAALVAVALMWMTFQSKQRSLLAAAELADRGRRYEPIDILDEPEVMAFYKTYLSSSEQDSEQELPEGTIDPRDHEQPE